MAISSDTEEKCEILATKSCIRHNLSMHCTPNRQEIATSARKGLLAMTSFWGSVYHANYNLPFHYAVTSPARFCSKSFAISGCSIP